MTLHTPRIHQGQIVEISYGWANERLYRRTHDRSDGSIAWAVAADEAEENAAAESSVGLWDDPPAVTRWRECPEPVED